MIYITTKNGNVSKINLFAIALFIIGLAQIWYPFIPAAWQPYELPVIGSITFALRTFFPTGGEIKKSL